MTAPERVYQITLTREQEVCEVLKQARIAEVTLPKYMWRDKRLLPLWHAIQQLDNAIAEQVRAQDAGEGE